TTCSVRKRNKSNTWSVCFDSIETDAPGPKTQRSRPAPAARTASFSPFTGRRSRQRMRGDPARTGNGLFLFLDVRLEEPERFVELAGEGGEDVGGVGVARLVGLVDRRAHRVRHCAV